MFVADDRPRGAALWSASLDGRTPARRLAEDVGGFVAVTDSGIVFSARKGDHTYVHLLAPGAHDSRPLLPQPVASLRDASPDGQWIVVEDRVAMGMARSPIVLYPAGGSTSARMPLCASCFVSWGPQGYLHVRFGGFSDADRRTTYLLPIPRGEVVPQLFRTGRLISEAEVVAEPGVQSIPGGTCGSDARPTPTCSRTAPCIGICSAFRFAEDRRLRRNPVNGVAEVLQQ